MSSKYRIYRYPANIPLNGKEFISEPDGKIQLFDSIPHAKMWIKRQDPNININIDDMMSEYGLDIELHCSENGYYEDDNEEI